MAVHPCAYDLTSCFTLSAGSFHGTTLQAFGTVELQIKGKGETKTSFFLLACNTGSGRNIR